MSRSWREFFYRNVLLFVVFVTGGVVLVLEVTATRILSVYFGSTIFTVSSVISVILLALSLGYFFGGRLADKRGSEVLFYQIISLSGLSVFLLYLISLLVIPSVAKYFSLREGPLVSSLLLFFLPSLLLGTLSPLVAKLQKNRLEKEGVGKITGDVFFWSTFGSIAGSLLSGFFLIPMFGISQILIGSGVLLEVVGFVGLLVTQKEKGLVKKFFLLLFVLPFLCWSLSFLTERFLERGIVYTRDGVYEKITISDGEFAGRPARFLQQDMDASSAMYLDSEDLVYDYTKYYEVYKLANPKITRALVIGGGAYIVPKALLADSLTVQVDVSEIEPGLLEVMQKYFRVPRSKRLVNHVEDGRRWLADSKTKYDLIFNDAFRFSVPSHLTTKEFFALSKSRLKPGGVFVGNLIGSLGEQNPSFLFSEMKTFKSVYPNSYFFAVSSPVGLYLQNVILVGYNSDVPLDLKKEKEGFLGTIAGHAIDLEQYDLRKHPVFTDDYAPVEYFIARRIE